MPTRYAFGLRSLSSVACASAVVLLTGVTAAHAVAKTFTGTTSMDWFTATNWMPAGEPAGGDDVTVPAGKTASLSSSTTIQSLTLAGTVTGPGNLTITGVTNWTAGVMGGSGATNANGGIHITGGATKRLDRTLNNADAATWADGGGIQISGTFNNLQGATFSISNDRTIASLAPGGRFANAGTLTKVSGTQRSALTLAFDNTGSVSVASGVLAFGGAGTHSGSFSATGGRLELSGGVQTFNASSTISGGGVLFSGGTIDVGGSYQATSTMVSAGVITLAGGITSTGPVTVTNGTLTFNNHEGLVAMPSLAFSAGTINGTSNLNIGGPLTWSGGTMGGSGVTNANAGLSLEGTAGRRLDRTLNHSGNGTWTGTQNLSISGVFNNLAGAVFEIQNDRGFSGLGSAARINNAGTIRKSMGTLSSASALTFENSGLVEVLSGTLTINTTYIQSAGVTRLASGTVLRSSNAIQLLGGRLEGNGTVDAPVANGAVFAPGLSPGRLVATRTFTQNASGTLSLELGGTAAGAFDQLSVTSNVVLDGALDVTLVSGYTPQPGDQFTILTYTAQAGDFATIRGLVFDVGRGFSRIVRPMEMVLRYGIEVCDDTIDNDNDELADCADAKCAGFSACFRTPTPTPTATATATSTPCGASCVGDCNCDSNVSGDEIVYGIQLSLADAPTSDSCPSLDADGTTTADIDELVAAVNNSYSACGTLPP